jgi:hypothetical protein
MPTSHITIQFNLFLFTKRGLDEGAELCPTSHPSINLLPPLSRKFGRANFRSPEKKSVADRYQSNSFNQSSEKEHKGDQS